MLAAYLAGVAVALNQSKVPPVMQVLLQSLHMDPATGGWLMSAFAVAGIILGLPAAFVLLHGAILSALFLTRRDAETVWTSAPPRATAAVQPVSDVQP